MDYEKLNQVKTKCKAALTRAENSGDPSKVIAAVKQARLAFNEYGWPDQWPIWAVAIRDLEFHDDRTISAAARAEADEWN